MKNEGKEKKSYEILKYLHTQSFLWVVYHELSGKMEKPINISVGEIISYSL